MGTFLRPDRPLRREQLLLEGSLFIPQGSDLALSNIELCPELLHRCGQGASIGQHLCLGEGIHPPCAFGGRGDRFPLHATLPRLVEATRFLRFAPLLVRLLPLGRLKMDVRF
ncbi:unnamed protein product [Phytomonas sp. EM1]|nr:unnamed protein product [Phytomonas sp. EM1]|eukprot:CCW65159.1 unnamed protein product [Phytomonas sp. isolate EM1]